MDGCLNSKHPLIGMSADEMRASGPLKDLPPYRARQVSHWLYERLATSFESMTDLPAGLRQTLGDHYTLPVPEVIAASRAEAGGAVKFLLRLEDGREIETVLINSGNRRTVCVSSQAGCAYGCTFCATGAMGPGRNLSVGEIVGQLLVVRRHMVALRLPAHHNIVFMGMGEPLANLGGLIPALRLLGSEDAMGVGNRRITVSTVGLAPQIRELADADVKVRLAFSLNATTDEGRERLMPVNRKYPIQVVLEALEYFQERSRMRVTLEYVLLDGVNDSTADAKRLGYIARGLGCRVNLIVYNPHPASPFRPPATTRVDDFVRWAHPLVPKVTVRFSKGRDILAACGQLSTSWRNGIPVP